MKSSQINFFMMPQDIAVFEDYLKTNNFVFITDPMPSSELVKESPQKTSGYITLSALQSDVRIKYIEPKNYYLVNILDSPIIEFSKPAYDQQHNIIHRGRLYYIKNTYNDKESEAEKPSEFLKAADDLFSWFRRQFKNQKLDGWQGFHITPLVAQWVRDGGKLAA